MSIDMTTQPLNVVKYVLELRQEAKRYRLQRDGARREADRLREELAVLRAEIRGLRGVPSE